MAFLYKQPLRHATWLELFFDLVFVAAIGIVTHDLAHTHHGHISFEQLLRFPLVFIPMWWIWMTHTLYSNRFDSDNRADRLFSLLLMGLVVILATFSKNSLDKEFLYFVIVYVLIRFFMAAVYFNVHSKYESEVTFAKDIAVGTIIGAIISLSSLLIDSNFKFLFFYAGILFDMLWQFKLKDKLKEKPVDKAHLVERLGLLAIIILGESMISIVSSLSSISWELYDILGATSGFILICAIWWIYFDSYHKFEEAKKIDTGHVLIYMHLFLCMGLLILANLIRHSILEDLDQHTFGMLAVIGLTFFYLGKQIPYMHAFPIWKKQIIINTTICIGITFASTFLPRIEYSLVGMMFGMFVYVFLTFKYILTVDVSDYLE